MKDTAVILTSGLLNTNNAKTAHGLIRGTDRFEIVGILDETSAGKDAGIVLDGTKRNIPIYSNISEAVETSPKSIKYCIIGVATAGGIIPPALQEDLLDIVNHGVSIINCLHHFLEDMPNFVIKASEKGVEILDIRKGQPNSVRPLGSIEIIDILIFIAALAVKD